MENFIYLYCVYIMIPLLCGFFLDLLLGDPFSKGHPVVLIGKLIHLFERKLRTGSRYDLFTGVLTAVSVSVVSAVLPWLLLCFIRSFSGIILYEIAASLLCWQMIAVRSMKTAGMKVCRLLEQNDQEAARAAVSMIVGRDTERLDRNGILRAAVETTAENTSDGVIAPLFYMALGGIPGLYFYKAVNTMDSMIGYKNEKYMLFGRAAARMDDVLNFIPARLTAVLMIVSAGILPGMDGRNAAEVFVRDHRKSSSPNAGCPEAAAAGALHISLLGPACYFGVPVDKPWIGSDDREPEPEDIRRTCHLMYMSSFLMIGLLLIVFPVSAGICMIQNG